MTKGAPYDRIATDWRSARTRLQPAELRYLDMLLAPLKPQSRILDLGCGTGTPVAAALIARGHRVVGVDESGEMLAVAAAAFPDHRWIHARMQDVAFAAASFDAAICWDALFHLPRAEHAAVIGNVGRWLAPGGRLMVSSGGVVGDTGFTDTMFGHAFFYDSLSPPELSALLTGAGFSLLVSEMCDAPDGGRNRGKWAIVAAKAPGAP